MMRREAKTGTLMLIGTAFLCVLCSWLPAGAQCDFGTNSADTSAESMSAPGGASLVRINSWIFFTYHDFDKELSIVHGVADPAVWCETGDWSLVSLADWQMVLLPDEVETLMVLAQGDDIQTTVWPYVELPPGVPASDRMCYVAMNYEPLASGTMDLHYTVNDFWWAWYHNRVGTESANAHGVLTTDSGERAVVNSGTMCTWRWSGGAFCGTCRSHIVGLH